MIFRVELARMSREIKTVVVEASSLEELNVRLEDVYSNEKLMNKEWEPDIISFSREGSHTIIGEVEHGYDVEIDFVLPPEESIFD